MCVHLTPIVCDLKFNQVGTCIVETSHEGTLDVSELLVMIV